VTLTHEQQALQLLELLDEHYGVRMDRAELSRLSSSANLVSDEDVIAWLVSTGNRVGLRIGFYDCAVSDVFAFARQRTAVVVPPQCDSGQPWVSITSARLFRLKVHICGAERLTRYMRAKRIRKLMKLPNASSRVRCLVARPVAAESRSNSGPVGPLRRLFGLFKPDRGDIWAMMVFSVVVGILTLAAPLAIEALVNTVAFGRYLQPIVMLALMLMVFLTFAAGLKALLAVVAEIIQRRLFVRVSEDLGYRLPRVRAEAFDGHYGPELVNRFFDVATIQKASSFLLLDGISLIMSAIIGMAVLGFYHPFLLGFDIILLALMAFTVFVLGRGAIGTAQKESKAKYYLASWLEDLVRCPSAFALHGGGRFAMERTDKLAVNYLDYRRKHFQVLMGQVVFALTMQAAASTVLLGLGGWLVISGELTLGQLVAAELIVTVVVGAFAKLGKHMESYYDMLASVDKVGVILDLPVEDQGGPVQIDAAGPAKVELRDVGMKVEGRSILSGVSATASCGGITVVTGPPASGKSLLLEAISGRRKVASGVVEIDGTELGQLDLETFRQNVGFSGEIEIFAGTLAENIHLYRPNIRSNDVRDALKLVGLLDEVRKFEAGVDMHLTSEGRPLSRDQGLRLMVARAIVGRPRILLIDGTLDGLPDTTAYDLLLQLTNPPQPWTLIVASGRAAIRAQADEIWELGRVGAKPTAG
jgi:putative ABC transport system ATP-binding protein